MQAQNLINRRQLATKLNKHIDTVRRMEKRGMLKRKNNNGHPKYDWAEVVEALGKKKEKTL